MSTASRRAVPRSSGIDPRETLTDRAYRTIEEQIVTLALAPGQVLSESTLAATLDIGRTPVREALQRLAREGLVLVLPRRGVMVSDIDVRKQLELLRVRRLVERLMAELCARRAGEDERRRFLELADAMGKAAVNSDDKGFMRLDRALNRSLAESCRNEFAKRTMGLMQGLSRRFWYVHYQEVLDLERCSLLHADLARAIGEADEHAAAVASDALMDYIESFTRSALDATTRQLR